jgi:hypothetical protein
MPTRSHPSVWCSALVLTLAIGAPATHAAQVVCRKKSGSVVIRDGACKKKETPVDVASLAPAPAVAGYATNASVGVATSSTPATVVSLSAASGASGAITVPYAAVLHIAATIEMHHSGGTADLPLGIVCQALFETGGTDVGAGPPMRMEVFGQSNHNAYVTMPLATSVTVPAGTYGVRVDCQDGYPEDYNPGARRIDKATLSVTAVKQ